MPLVIIITQIHILKSLAYSQRSRSVDMKIPNSNAGAQGASHTPELQSRRVIYHIQKMEDSLEYTLIKLTSNKNSVSFLLN